MNRLTTHPAELCGEQVSGIREWTVDRAWHKTKVSPPGSVWVMAVCCQWCAHEGEEDVHAGVASGPQHGCSQQAGAGEALAGLSGLPAS